MFHFYNYYHSLLLCTITLFYLSTNCVLSVFIKRILELELELETQAAILLPGQSPSLAVATHNELPVLSHTQPTLFKAKLWVWLLARIHYGNHRYRLATQTVDSQQRSAMASAPVQPQANNQGLTDTCHYTNTNKIDKARLTNCPVVLKYVTTRVGIDEF